MKRLLLNNPMLNNRKFNLLLIVLLGLASAQVSALSTDKDQPIEIEADTAEIDDLNNISIYRGNVIVVQGSIYMTGDKMTVYNTEDDELDILIMEGKPATYKQLPDNSTVYDEARALRMEYHELKNMIYLYENAWSKQGDGEISGNQIEYNTELSKVMAWSAKQTLKPGEQIKSQDRVRIILHKKKDEPE